MILWIYKYVYTALNQLFKILNLKLNIIQTTEREGFRPNQTAPWHGWVCKMIRIQHFIDLVYRLSRFQHFPIFIRSQVNGRTGLFAAPICFGPTLAYYGFLIRYTFKWLVLGNIIIVSLVMASQSVYEPLSSIRSTIPACLRKCTTAQFTSQPVSLLTMVLCFKILNVLNLLFQ